MSTVSQETWNVAECAVRCEFDLSAAAAVTATRGDDVVVTKTGTGVYTVRVVGRTFYEVLKRFAWLSRAAPGTANAQVTSIDLDGAGDGTGAVITVTTLDDFATPAAADVGAASTVSVEVVFRTRKIV